MNKNPTVADLVKDKRYVPIIKDVGGRRMLIGFERKKRSSKSHIKHFLSAPMDLAQAVKQSKAEPTTPTEGKPNE